MLRTISNPQQCNPLGSLWHQQSRLLVAIQNNNIQTAESLLQSGIDADFRFSTGSEKRPAICLCVERGHIAMAELLLEYGCSINQYDNSGFTPLHIASAHGYTRLVELLLKNRANVKVVSNYGHTPLHLATQHTSLDIVKLLVDNGSELNKRDREEHTPLAIACARGSYEIAEFLLLRGADPNAVDCVGNTPLLHAVNGPHGCLKLVNILLACGAKVNVTNKHGETPLLAIIRGTKHQSDSPIPQLIVATLVHAGCQLDVLTPLGQSPLHLAIVQHQDELVELLARVGCDPNSRDRLGLTPLFHLAKDGKSRLVELLLAVGVDVTREMWLREEKWVAEIIDPDLRNRLLTAASNTSSLKALSRIRLRKCLGPEADKLAENLTLPTSIQEYLLLMHL